MMDRDAKSDFASPVKCKARIESWDISGSVRGPRLEGVVHGHPRFNDGQFVTTSTIMPHSFRDDLKEGDTVETANTMYTLGRPYLSKSEGG